MNYTLSVPAIVLVRPAGFEPAAYGFVVRRSIRAELRAPIILFEISVEHKLMCLDCQWNYGLIKCLMHT